MVEGPGPDSEISVEFARRLYDRMVAWYESAERKAQLILTLAGLFVSFLTASVLRKPADLRATTENFGPETWALLALMAVCLLLSVLCAVVCLWSRVYKQAELQQNLREAGVQVDRPETIDAKSIWFFQIIAGLNPNALGERLKQVGSADEAKILGVNAVPLAQRVARKHHWVNYGFAFIALTLVCFFCAGLSYAIRVS